MSNVKVIHGTDVGSSLEVVAGKLEAAGIMATDAELNATVGQATADMMLTMDAKIAADNAIEAAEAAAKLTAEEAKSARSAYALRAQMVFKNSARWVMSGTRVKFDTLSSFDQARLIVLGAGQDGHSAGDGYYGIHMPPAGTVLKGLGVADSVVDADGFFVMGPGWSNLWYKLPTEGSNQATQGEFYITRHGQSNYTLDHDMILIGTLSRDNGVIFKLADGMQVVEGTNYPDTPWIDMTPHFAPGIVNHGNGFQACRFRRQGNRVYCEGVAQDTTGTVGVAGGGNMKLAELPIGFRPNLRHIFTSNSGADQRRVDVASDGSIEHVVNGSIHQWIPLEFSYSLN